MESKKIQLKRAYNLENLMFYSDNRKHYFCCKYTKEPEEDEIGIETLDFFLKSLSTSQAVVYFVDVDRKCVGIEDLRKEYLTFILSGILGA